MSAEPEYITRLRNDYLELSDRCNKLEKFTFSKFFRNLELYEQQLLHHQLAYMIGYRGCLDKRLSLELNKLK